MTDKHNPPAFPQTEPNGMVTVGADGAPKAEYSTTGGMTLRDWFAGRVISGLYAGRGGPVQTAFIKVDVELAYEIADAMLVARAKGGDA